MTVLDPELARQLSVAEHSNATVEVVVRLRPGAGTPAPAPEETERITHELVSRVQRTSGQHEDALNVFRYLGSFAISARPAFLKTLIAQPEVAGAIANNQPQSALMPPVEKRPATLDEVGRDTGQPRKPTRTAASGQGAGRRTATRKPTPHKPAKSKARRSSR